MVNSLVKQQTQLHELLGLSQDNSVLLKAESIPEKPHYNADSLIESAMKNRGDYRAAITAREAARLKLQSAKIENLPFLGAQATAGLKNGILPKIDNFIPNWTAGAQVSMPIYDGKRAKFHVVEAEQGLRAVDAGLADLSLRIRTSVRQAKFDVEAAFDKLVLTETQVRLAQEALSMAHLKYEAGVITNLDVLDAEKDFAQAKLSYVAGQYQCLLSCLALDQAVGRAVPGIN